MVLTAFNNDVRDRETFYGSLRVPCRRAVEGNIFSLLPKQWVNINTAMLEATPDKMDTEYVAMLRKCPKGYQPGAFTHVVSEGMDVFVEYRDVPMDEVSVHEAKGWSLWLAPYAAVQEPVYADKRQVARARDIQRQDRSPVDDSDHFLRQGNAFMRSHLIRSKTPWVKGQLVGPDGGEEAVKNMSPSYLPPERATEEFVESRSATSITHVIMRSRPAGVCPGWGGWDEWLDWQSYGRRVPEDKVVDVECSKDALRPFRIANDAGETVETVQPHLATSTLQSTQKLESLYANITKNRDYKTAKPKAKAEPKHEPGRTWTTLL